MILWMFVPNVVAYDDILFASSSPTRLRHSKIESLDRDPITVDTDGYALPVGVT